MKISELFPESDVSINSDIRGLTDDSRQVKPGYLFAALSGLRYEGESFIADAVSAGASAILVDVNYSGDSLPDDVCVIKAAEPRQALALASARFYGLQPKHIAAITGTNGKTSTADFVRQIWDQQNLKAASLGTLGVRSKADVTSSLAEVSMTTPDPVSLHAGLADMAAAGFDYLVMEASSHGLDQYRLDGVKVKAAAFTNLSHDHLDYHGGMQEYFKAKARLFENILAPDGYAVLNSDIEEFDTLKNRCQQNGQTVISYGEKADDIRIISCQPMPEGQSLKLQLFGTEYSLTLPLVGYFQVYNALCALGLVCACALECSETASDAFISSCVESLHNLKGVPGRLEYVQGHSNAAIYVDYAHTPDALLHVLKALRPHTKGNLYCLVGCGGDRDKTKRPVMAQIAQEHSDAVIITDDNPRTEDPAAIRSQMLEAAPDAKEIGDRKQAIIEGVQSLSNGDVLLIAGKGHEQGQIIGDTVFPFDDKAIAESAVKDYKSDTDEHMKLGET